MDETLRLAAHFLGPPDSSPGQRPAEEDPAILMQRKHRWADKEGSVPGQQLGGSTVSVDGARSRLRWRKHGFFTQVTTPNKGSGETVRGTRMMDELASQMVAKQERALRLLPNRGQGPTALDCMGQQVAKAAVDRTASALGYFGLSSKLLKALLEASYDLLARVVRATGRLS